MNCKPGDLAIMTHARGVLHTAKNVGRICRVVRPHGNHTYARGDTLFCWWVEFVGSAGRDANGDHTNDGFFPDAYLKRIDPPQEMLVEEHREEITA